jgi:hypothetical protein
LGRNDYTFGQFRTIAHACYLEPRLASDRDLSGNAWCLPQSGFAQVPLEEAAGESAKDVEATLCLATSFAA